jgi:hypothetical protein
VGHPDSRFQRIRRLDIFGLVPVWTFFAPRPAWTDYHLLYRDVLADGTATQWRDVSSIGGRRLLDAVWHPNKRLHKAITDLVRTYTKELEAAVRQREDGEPAVRLRGAEELPAHLLTSFSYLLLLQMVSALPRFGEPAATQFMILKHDRVSAPEARPMLVSALHRL